MDIKSYLNEIIDDLTNQKVQSGVDYKTAIEESFKEVQIMAVEVFNAGSN